MSDLSPHLALPLILPDQAQKHVTHNEAIDRLDLIVQLAVVQFDATTCRPARPRARSGPGDWHRPVPGPGKT